MIDRLTPALKSDCMLTTVPLYPQTLRRIVLFLAKHDTTSSNEQPDLSGCVAKLGTLLTDGFQHLELVASIVDSWVLSGLLCIAGNAKKAPKKNREKPSPLPKSPSFAPPPRPTKFQVDLRLAFALEPGRRRFAAFVRAGPLKPQSHHVPGRLNRNARKRSASPGLLEVVLHGGCAIFFHAFWGIQGEKQTSHFEVPLFGSKPGELATRLTIKLGFRPSSGVRPTESNCTLSSGEVKRGKVHAPLNGQADLPL